MKLGTYELPGVFVGDCREMMRALPDGCVHALITSPPYLGLRAYGVEPTVWGGDLTCAHQWEESSYRLEDHGDDGKSSSQLDGGKNGQSATRIGEVTDATCTSCGAWRGCLGLEPTYSLYVTHMVEVFREARRVLRDDGLVFLNLGDSYGGGRQGPIGKTSQKRADPKHVTLFSGNEEMRRSRRASTDDGIKSKDLIGVPWAVAFALRDDGWYLRQEIIWAKGVSGQRDVRQQILEAAKGLGIDDAKAETLADAVQPYVGNSMPESVEDRAARTHEHVFMLAKSKAYFYDGEAVREPATGRASGNKTGRLIGDAVAARGRVNEHRGMNFTWDGGDTRNLRSVWTIGTRPWRGAHYAVMPTGLVEPMIKAATSEKGACAKCGAPWSRIVETTRTLDGEPLPPDAPAIRPVGIENPRPPGGRPGHYRYGTERRQAGWEPSCECGPEVGEPVPCVVLDPFMGSGTVGRVAEDLGRNWIGFDLNPEYAGMAASRTAQRALPLGSPEPGYWQRTGVQGVPDHDEAPSTVSADRAPPDLEAPKPEPMAPKPIPTAEPRPRPPRPMPPERQRPPRRMRIEIEQPDGTVRQHDDG